MKPGYLAGEAFGNMETPLRSSPLATLAPPGRSAHSLAARAALRQRAEDQSGVRFSMNACTPSSAEASIMLHAIVRCASS